MSEHRKASHSSWNAPDDDRPRGERRNNVSRRRALVLGSLVPAVGLSSRAGASGLEAPSQTRVDVRDFGAVGDGKADDTRAIEKALKSSLCVELSHGTYWIKRPLEIRDHQVLFGCGSTLMGAGDHAGIVRDPSSLFITNPVVRDLRFKNFSVALDAEAMNYGRFENLFVEESRIGFRLATGSDGVCYYNVFTSCHVPAADEIGVVFEGMRNFRFGGEVKIQGSGHRVALRDRDGTSKVILNGISGRVNGETGRFRQVVALDDAGAGRIHLNGPSATVRVGNGSRGGQAGRIEVRDSAGRNTIVLDGQRGRIFTENGDCAEDFDVSLAGVTEPGDVMVINGAGHLERCSEAYDRRVAGVLSGAGDEEPGIVLGRKARARKGRRRPLALNGRVFCRVDANFGAVEVGDLLTTSPTAGHAMRATDPDRSFGAVIGKALVGLGRGRGLIPVLVALQ